LDKRTSIKETIKSIVIVVLTLSTILLLYVFWKDLSFNQLSFSEIDLDFGFGDEEEMPAERLVEDIALPSAIIIGTGEGDYFVKTDTKELYGSPEDPSSLVSVICGFGKGEELFIEEISEEQYKEAYKYKSVRAVFNYLVPILDYYKFKGEKAFSGVEDVSNLSEIGFSEVAKDSVLAYDAQQNRYFRIVTGETGSDWMDTFFAAHDFSEEASYYPLEAFLGEGNGTDVMVPMYMESDMTVREASLGRDPAADLIRAKAFFGKTFDFVRKIEEAGGKVIYMYGYGETTLILAEDGSIEYKAGESGRQTLNYFEALDTAIKFIDRHEPVPTGGAVLPGIRLEKSSIDDSGYKTYRFEFSQMVGGEEIFFKDGPSVVVEVSGGVVSYFYAKRPFVAEPSADAKQAKEPVFAAINTIAANYESIAQMLGEELTMEEVAQRLTSVKYGYLCEEGALSPVWEIKAAGLNESLYFDLYTAKSYGLD
jgi:hypothetical protein